MAKAIGLIKYVDDIVKMYVEDEISATKIALKYNCAVSGIYRVLEKAGIKRRESRESRKTYKVDEHYFDNIDTSEKAYILVLFLLMDVIILITIFIN